MMKTDEKLIRMGLYCSYHPNGYRDIRFFKDDRITIISETKKRYRIEIIYTNTSKEEKYIYKNELNVLYLNDFTAGAFSFSCYCWETNIDIVKKNLLNRCIGEFNSFTNILEETKLAFELFIKSPKEEKGTDHYEDKSNET